MSYDPSTRQLVVVFDVTEQRQVDPEALASAMDLPPGCAVAHAKWNDAQLPALPADLDREVRAIAQCVDVLGPLDPSQASGVADYIAGRYVRGR